MWRGISSEVNSASTTSGSGVEGGDAAGTPAWAWVDVGIAWAIAPAVGGSLQLSLWGSIVPSWLCVTVALAYGLRAEEVRAGKVKTEERIGEGKGGWLRMVEGHDWRNLLSHLLEVVVCVLQPWLSSSVKLCTMPHTQRPWFSAA